MARYAFFVGVNQYNDKNINPLKCAERDARRLASLFEHKLGFKASYLEERSAEDIEERITRLGEGLRPADTFVFYFAGHGKAVADEQYFLLPRANLGNLVNGTGRLSFRSLKALTSQPAWRGVSRVFIFDACRSELESGARDGAAPKFKGEAILRDAAFASTGSVESPLVLINACSENQCAIEVIGEDGEGHGVFSSALAAEIGGGQLSIDDRLAPRLAAQMQNILAGHGQDRVQHPMICGALPVVLNTPQQAAAAEADAGTARRATDDRLWRLACAEDTVDAYKEYLGNRDIDCLHEKEALLRIKALRAEAKTHEEAEVKAERETEQDTPRQCNNGSTEPLAAKEPVLELVVSKCHESSRENKVEIDNNDALALRARTGNKVIWVIGVVLTSIVLLIGSKLHQKDNVPMPDKKSDSTQSSPALPLLSSVDQEKRKYDTQALYKNNRFLFSINYPSQLLKLKDESENGDGRIFYSAGSSAEFRVYGCYQMDEISREYKTEMESVLDSGKVEISYKRLAKDWYVLSWVESGNIFYKKSIYKNNVVATIFAKYPLAHRNDWDEVVAEMAGSLRF